MLSWKKFYKELTVTPIFGKHVNLRSEKCSEFSFTKSVEERILFLIFLESLPQLHNVKTISHSFCGDFIEGYGKMVTVVDFEKFQENP